MKVAKFDMHTRKVKEYKSLNIDISNNDEDGNENNNSITIHLSQNF